MVFLHFEIRNNLRMRRIVLPSLLILFIIILFAALREIALRNLPSEPQPLRPLYRALNANQYRLYSVDTYKVFLNISESRMMYERAVGEYEPDTFDSVRSRIKPGMTFIDVGANKGDYTFMVGHLTGETGKVIAVEPVPENRYWLDRSLAKNELDNVEVVDAALSDQDGHTTFQRSKQSGMGKLMPGSDESEKETIRVRTAMLDSLVPELGLERVDAIKIDVEGAELAVVRGAQQTIDRFRPIIWLELHPQEDADRDWLSRFFTEREYRITRLSTQQAIPQFEKAQQPYMVRLTPQ